MSEFKTYGTCEKCNTEDSELFQYRPGYWICKANECVTEETERDSGRHIVQNQKIEDYRKVVSRSMPD